LSRIPLRKALTDLEKMIALVAKARIYFGSGQTKWLWFSAYLLLFVVALAQYWVPYDDGDSVPHFPESFSVAWNLAEKGAYSNPFVTLHTGPSAHLAPAFPAFLALLIHALGGGSLGMYAVKASAALLLCIQLALFPLFSRILGMGRLNGLIAVVCWLFARVGLVLHGRQAVVLFGWEAFYTAFLVAIGMCLCRRYRDDRSRLRWPLGIILGTLLLTSPTACIIFVAWLAYEAFLGCLTLIDVAWLVFLPLLIAFPWLVRNYHVFGRTVFVRDNFGLEMSTANNDCSVYGFTENLANGCFARIHPNANIDEAKSVLALGEPNYNALKLSEAKHWIEDHPGRFLKLSGLRLAAFWLPPAGTPRFSFIGPGRVRERFAIDLMTVLSVAGLFMLYRADRQSAVLCILGLLTYPVVYYLVSYEYRYRYPILWVTFLLGSLPITGAVHRIWPRIVHMARTRLITPQSLHD
jgi:hypothetical protein